MTETLSAATVAVGDERTSVVVSDLKRTQIVMYAGASSDFNPLHTDEPFATQVAGNPTVMSHGMLTMGMAEQVLADWFGSDNVCRYRARFLAPVWPGDTITVTATVTAVAADTAPDTAADTEGEADLHRLGDGRQLAEISLTATTGENGVKVLTGSATVRLDGAAPAATTDGKPA